MRVPRPRRRWLGMLVFFGIVLAVLWFSLDTIATWQTRKAMDQLTGYRTTFSDVELEPFKLAVTIRNLKVVKESAGGDEQPVFACERLRAGLAPRQLFRGHIVGAGELHNPRVFLINARDKGERQIEPETPHLDEVLEKMIPVKVDRLTVKNGDLTFIDKTVPELPRIRMTEIDATLENLATRPALAEGQPTMIALSALLQRSGRLTGFLTADPLAQGIFFAGRFELKGLKLRELREMVAAKTGVQPAKGTLDLYAEVTAENGRLRGGIKPILKDAEVEAGKDNLGDRLKATFADAALDLMKDEVPGRHAVATIIPIHGTINDPKAQLWPTVLGVVRNAFVLGVNEGYASLPPPQAEEEESAATQAINALNPKEGPPKAQPENNGKKKEPEKSEPEKKDRKGPSRERSAPRSQANNT